MVLYAILAAVSWFTLDGKILIGGRLVELRLIPLVVIGGFALRTVMAMKAERIRRGDKWAGSFRYPTQAAKGASWMGHPGIQVLEGLM
jgi:hypothetical protein